MRILKALLISILIINLGICFAADGRTKKSENFLRLLWNGTVGSVFPILKDIPYNEDTKWEWEAGYVMQNFPELDITP